jgi:NRPS condensation-like uncharacterized protein
MANVENIAVVLCKFMKIFKKKRWQQLAFWEEMEVFLPKNKKQNHFELPFLLYIASKQAERPPLWSNFGNIFFTISRF